MRNFLEKAIDTTGGALIVAGIAAFIFIGLVLGLSYLLDNLSKLIPSIIINWFSSNGYLGALLVTAIITSLVVLAGLIVLLIEKRKGDGKTKLEWYGS